MRSSRVMVTGGSGFIGSNLVNLLLEDHEVFVLDITPLEKAYNLKEVKDHPNLHYKVGDIRDRETLEKFWIRDAEVIYHLASVVGIKNYLADPLLLIDIIVLGTRNVLELALNNDTKILFTSTSEIYGKNTNIPWLENSDRVLGATSVDRWSYSTAKSTCEHMLYGAYNVFGLPFTIVRFFNAYGPRQNPYFVVSQSIYKALRNEEPLLYDGGRMTRCFTYVEDIVKGIITAANDPNALGEAFNIGSSVETTIKEVVEIIIEEAGTKVNYKNFDTVKEYGKSYEDIIRRVPDITKARDLLAWEANTSLCDGIRKTINWARNNEWWLADRNNF